MSEIIIDGVSITKLAASQQHLKKHGNEYISQQLKVAESIISNLEEITEDKAKELLTALENTVTVSSALGIEYYIPWNGEYESTWLSKWGDFSYDEDNHPTVPEDICDSVFGVLEDMTSTNYQWHNSNCY